MKIKNLLMQWFVLTPLTLLQSACGWAIVSWILMIANDDPAPGSIFLPFLAFGVGLLISKLILKIKGKEVEYTYYDDEFEYEIKHDYGDKYSIHRTKGGWTSETKFIVWVYTFMSPITILLQIVANIFAVVAFFKNRIASWYGRINYDTLSHPVLQNILHFLLSIVILDEGHELK